MSATHCPHCGLYVLQRNAGDYYHEKACEARNLRPQLERCRLQIAQLKRMGSEPIYGLEKARAELRRLKARLANAEYVGD